METKSNYDWETLPDDLPSEAYEPYENIEQLLPERKFFKAEDRENHTFYFSISQIISVHVWNEVVRVTLTSKEQIMIYGEERDHLISYLELYS